MKKGEKALTLCMPLQLKCKEWDKKRQEAGLLEDSPDYVGHRTVFVYKRNWFVLSQTEGTPFTPEPIPAWNKEAALASLGIREEPFASTDGNCQGYATQCRAVAVSPLAVLPWKTRFHEIAVARGTAYSAIAPSQMGVMNRKGVPASLSRLPADIP